MFTSKYSRRPLKLGEILEVNIINLFGFTLNDSIYQWGENYVQDHPNYTFEE